MRAAACGQVEVSNINQPQLSGLLRWQLAQFQAASLLQRDKADSYRAIFHNNFIGQPLRVDDLISGQRFHREINGAALCSHVKAHSRRVK